MPSMALIMPHDVLILCQNIKKACMAQKEMYLLNCYRLLAVEKIMPHLARVYSVSYH